ncbi:NAD-dependent protein deacetylase [Pseudarthrobacter sp. J1738]|uniref:NAD-dependent protein deacetylase n=1 Tax=unclassified Pseudarthrobacter TaxID=2647000 RepID=UPI003D2D4D1A
MTVLANAEQERSLLEQLAGRRFVLLTGAGLSTDSGIPDYRGPNAQPRSPITYQEFVAVPAQRQRYWARNHLGWGHLRHAEPNSGHRAVARLERLALLGGVITQNVDRLHQGAGSENVVDLHGRYDQVVCLNCRRLFSRNTVAELLEALNPGFEAEAQARGAGAIAPDADAELEDRELLESFVIAHCPVCSGMLKPDFVFFGESVPKQRVQRAADMVDAAQALLVAGSSLTVMSGLRFVKQAAKENKPVVILNRGETRGDSLATLKLDVGTSEALEWLADTLGDLDSPSGSTFR